MSDNPIRAAKPRLRNVVRTDNSLHGTYKGHDISIERDKYGWYIMVTAPDGCYAYDGWWKHPEASLEDAVFEAVCGACIDRREVSRG